jgi:hypothetical protein
VVFGGTAPQRRDRWHAKSLASAAEAKLLSTGLGHEIAEASRLLKFLYGVNSQKSLR